MEKVYIKLSKEEASEILYGSSEYVGGKSVVDVAALVGCLTVRQLIDSLAERFSNDYLLDVQRRMANYPCTEDEMKTCNRIIQWYGYEADPVLTERGKKLIRDVNRLHFCISTS